MFFLRFVNSSRFWHTSFCLEIFRSSIYVENKNKNMDKKKYKMDLNEDDYYSENASVFGCKETEISKSISSLNESSKVSFPV